MPTAAKTTAAMSKHLTAAELEARASAEAEILPDRNPELKPPAIVNKDSKAKAYWVSIVQRMEGLAILDDLDSEMLAGYVLQLSRRDRMIELNLKLTKAAEKAAKDAEDPDIMLEAMGKLDSLTGKLQALERNLLSVADKLGLTPSARVRLAQKRAAAAEEVDPDDDLYG